MSTVYNMPSGVPFLRSLAHGLQTHFGDDLQNGLVLLPTRRAARALEFAFVHEAAARGVQAALLPRLRPLADVNPDEPPFEPGELAGRVQPAIDPVQRRFEIAKLVARYHERASDLPLDPATALHMADPLIDIMDDAAMEQVSISDQPEWQRVCAEAATHFQHAAQLYQIVEQYWPKRLAELEMMDPSARRVALLNALSDIWSETPPDYPVIVAGSTGTLKATARLMQVVANMPRGMVILPGLQDELPDKVWNSIDARHPQSSLKGLLSVMEIDRQDVPIWPWVVGAEDRSLARKRRRILAEALVPVDATGDWLERIGTLTTGEGADVFETALETLSLIEANTDAEEALAIALIMRETLETPGRTAALVTPDQLLSQRVRARLARWGVDVAMSQGVPVEQTPIGVFLTSLLELAQDPDGPIEIALTLSQELTSLGQAIGDVKAEWEIIERKYYRGLRPHIDVVGALDLVQSLFAAAEPLLKLEGKVTPDIWAAALIDTANALATTDTTFGAARVWGADGGGQAASVLDGIITHGAALPTTNVEGFAQLLRSLLQGAVSRPTGGTHPRLQILGPLEARLLDVDDIILGGLNEGTWPGGVNAGPFLSRGMREQMKLSLPERRYGLAAHDFAELAANPNVYLTRSEKSDSGPTVASRWVWRLKTIIAGTVSPASDEQPKDLEKRQDAKVAELLGTGQKYLDWARQMDRPEELRPVSRPNPKPPVDKRWARQGRQISITGVSKWIRDPYSVFAREVLRLKPLDALDAPLDARHFGSAMHEGIELYVRAALSGEIPALHDPANADHLQAFLRSQLLAHGFDADEVFKETPRLEAVTAALMGWFAQRHAAGFDVVGTEVNAKADLDGLDFVLKGQLDLVERSPTGYAFTDFKTGTPATVKTVAAGFDLQLPLAAWLAAQGALEGHKAGETDQLAYVRIKGSNDDFSHAYVSAPARNAAPAGELAAEAMTIVTKLITAYDNPDTGYPSQPRAQYTDDYGDYDDLARRDEWSAISGRGEA
ncbi:MAG: PD-(D/E)XK nuclease family protein [Litorimonas sp.]